MRHTAILEGPSGTGKTRSLRTAVPHVDNLLCLTTETGFEHVLFKDDGGIGETPPRSKVHWHYHPPARISWADLKIAGTLINTNTVEALQSMKGGVNKYQYTQFLEMLDVLGNFTCDCCNKSWGSADDWDESIFLAVDGLSGLSSMSMDLATGAKPVKTQPDWGVAMDNLERFVGKLAFDTHCHVGLISHVDRERDEVTGGTWLTLKTLGVKLAPKLVPMWDEVIMAKRDGTEFLWSTAEPNADLKTRFMPLDGKLPPDWGLLLRK